MTKLALDKAAVRKARSLARKAGRPIVKIADLIEYRLAREMLVRPAAESMVRPRLGGVSAEFRACLYTTDVERTEYLALVLGDIAPDEPVLEVLPADSGVDGEPSHHIRTGR